MEELYANCDCSTEHCSYSFWVRHTFWDKKQNHKSWHLLAPFHMTQAALLAVEADGRASVRYDSAPPVGDVSVTTNACPWKRASGSLLVIGHLCPLAVSSSAKGWGWFLRTSVMPPRWDQASHCDQGVLERRAECFRIPQLHGRERN